MARSYIRINIDDDSLLLFWHTGLKKYTYLASPLVLYQPAQPLTVEEYEESYPFDFAGEAKKRMETLGYNGDLKNTSSLIKGDELKQKVNVGVDQFFFLQTFETGLPITREEAEDIKTKYYYTHSDEPAPIIVSAKEMRERDDIFEDILKKHVRK